MAISCGGGVQDEAVSLLARESLGALRRVAEVHLATLASPDVLEDPRTALVPLAPLDSPQSTHPTHCPDTSLNQRRPYWKHMYLVISFH